MIETENVGERSGREKEREDLREKETWVRNIIRRREGEKEREKRKFGEKEEMRRGRKGGHKRERERI